MIPSTESARSAELHAWPLKPGVAPARAAGISVLHVVSSLSASQGGPSEVIRMLCPALAREGCTVDVITTEAGAMTAPIRTHVADGVTYRTFTRQTEFYSASVPMTLWLRRNVASYALVHVHGLFAYPPVIGASLALRYSVPYIVRPFGTLDRWGRENRRPLLKKCSMYIAELNLLKHAAAVQYTSEEEQRQAEDLGFAHRGVVVPNAVDLEAAAGANDVSSRNCYSESRGRATILFVGRLHPVKGVDLLLTAFARAADRHPQATLAILGSGAADYEERLKAMAVTLGIASKVLWLGFRTGQEKWAALAASDLVVLPSHSENFGIAAAEAMACGRPVLVTEGVGIHALVSQAEAGVVCSADAGSLAAGLDQLLASLQLRRRMGANGRRLAATEFSTRAVCARILDLYRSAVA